jgi:hypothetical protein
VSIIAVIVTVLCIICMSITGLVSTLTGFRMVDELNKTRPADQKFKAIGFHRPFERYEMLSEYRRLYPNSRLMRRMKWAYACGWIAVVLFGGVNLGVFAALWALGGGAAIAWFTWWASTPRTFQGGSVKR